MNNSNNTDRASAAAPPDPSVAMRRMHYTFTGLHVVVVVILQLMLFFRVVHMAFLLGVSTGFAFVVAGVFVGIMASNIDHLVVFTIGSAQSRVIVWTNVAAIVFVVLNILQVLYLMAMPPLTAGAVAKIFAPWTLAVSNDADPATQDSPTRPVTLGLSVDDMEALLSHHIQEADRLILVVMLVLFGAIGLLHLISLIVYSRIALSTASSAGYQHVSSNTMNTLWKHATQASLSYANNANTNNNNNNSNNTVHGNDSVSLNINTPSMGDLEAGGSNATGRRTPNLQSQPRYNKGYIMKHANNNNNNGSQ